MPEQNVVEYTLFANKTQIEVENIAPLLTLFNY